MVVVIHEVVKLIAVVKKVLMLTSVIGMVFSVVFSVVTSTVVGTS